MSLVIRRAEERDIHGIAELEKLCFSTPWSEDAFSDEIRKNDLALYLAAEDLDRRELVAYAGIWKILDEGHITNVAVHPQYRGLGIGKRIVEALLEAAEQAGALRQTLEVRISNEPALRLYTGLGFQEAGLRKGYYEDNGEDALIMWRE